jgi:hypothetical protein
MKVAQEYAHKKHRCPVNWHLLRTLVELVAKKKEEMKFEEALRFSLNELNLYTEDQGRQVYRCAAAKYFSEHSAKVRSARAQAGKPPKRVPPRPSVTGTPKLEGNQWTFKF